jgi:hypothetical protein
MGQPLQPITDQIIIDGLAAGHTQGFIAQQAGVSRRVVNERAKRLRPLAEAAALDYFERMIPKSTEINIACVDSAKTIYATVPPIEQSAHAPLLNQAHKIADRVLQSVGIAPSLAPSVVVQQFIQVNATAILSPQLAGLFNPESLAAIQDQAEEAEWTDLEGDAD